MILSVFTIQGPIKPAFGSNGGGILVAERESAYNAMRYTNPFWRLYDWLLLTLALLHGMNGLRVVIDDYVRSRGWRLTLQSVAGLVTLTYFMLGTITLVTFQTAGALGPSCLP